MMEETSGGSHWVTAEPDMESGVDGKIVYRLQDQTPQDHKLSYQRIIWDPI